MAIHADPASLLEYRRQICPQIENLPPAHRPQPGDFCKSVWEGKWNRLSGQMPAEVTRTETFRNWRAHQNDGRYNTNRRLDPVAKAQELVDPMFRAGEPLYKPADEQEVLKVLSETLADVLTPMNSAFTREGTRQLFLRAGLKPKHASFGVRVVHDGAKQRDNPTAWKAISRQRTELSIEVRKLLDSK